MLELSPQAQEVFWAFNRAASGKPEEWHYLPSIAAALRAAVKLTKKQKAMKTFGVTVAKTQAYCLESDLLAIAAELEAQ